TSTVEVDREEVKERIGVISSRSQATRAVAPIVIEDEDPCSGITCREGEKCFEGQCFRKSCAELGGGVCGGGSSCSGTSVVGSDTTACCVGRCVVDDLCADVTCESGKECRDGVCEALSCSEQGGVQCSTEQLCVGRLGADCCTSCNERADSCAGVTCGSNVECEAGQCILLSCEALGGELCSNEQTCINELVASDEGICCEDACEDPAGGGDEGSGGGSDENNGSSVKEFDIVARKFEFDPSTIEVDVGDSVLFRVTSEDVPHGIVISEFGVDEFLAPGDEVEIAFEADRAGEFDIFCSVFCGSGHGGMTGTLIVR
ncbi:MAG: cupredoxin domain-containing protein, partial [Anaerolineales bacterium]|nr:cupredoxin domain-containing protein [Anaerolineales bacterium]